MIAYTASPEAGVSPADAATLLGVTRQFVDRLIADGKLTQRYKPGSEHRIIGSSRSPTSTTSKRNANMAATVSAEPSTPSSTAASSIEVFGANLADTASQNCHPPTGVTLSSMNRIRTPDSYSQPWARNGHPMGTDHRKCRSATLKGPLTW